MLISGAQIDTFHWPCTWPASCHYWTLGIEPGFALETENLLENGKKKLAKKNLNCIVLNTLQDNGAGFGVDTNKISILDNHNNLKEFELKSKTEVAADIVDYVKNYTNK